MSGSNKILTVSYGTFSCTLEGFDDPFGTMRGIAEYFRDLAADDRYFGAEPPTPDVEMLQSIAQKEVRRRVETSVGENGIALRQIADAAEPSAAADDHGPLAEDDEYLMSDEPEDILDFDPAMPAESAGHPPESIAEKLRRIRAVVSRTHLAETAEIDAEEDEDAPSQAAKRDRALSETIASITRDLSDADDIDAADDDDEPEAWAPREQTADVADGDGQSSDPEPWEAIEDGEEADRHEAEHESPVDIALAEVERHEDERFAAFDRAEEPSASEPDGAPAENAFDDLSDEAAISAYEFDDEGEAAEDAGDHAPEHFDRAETGESDRASETGRRATRPLQPIEEDERGVGRILAETDSKLLDDDGIRRRRVISQMRAAVASIKAERALTRPVEGNGGGADARTAYRRDLSEAIGGDRDKPRSAPLVLVSEQRIDAPERLPDEIGERRVPKRDAQSFAEFVEIMGANELPELLEAAAAYTAFVENQPQFSRPEIMRRVARIEPSLHLTREEGLRSFGQLLRQGKLRKLERGQFTIREDTRFNPAQQIAGE